MPIDTQQVVDRLTGAGVPDQQARAHASVLNETLQDYELRARDQFVSKQDLAEVLVPVREALAALNEKVDALAAQLNMKVDALDEKMDAKIDAGVAKVKAEVAVWIVSAGLFQTSIIAALILELAN